eukprot:scaffold85289_cov59-Attheya_sp.AAC.1
MASSPLSLALIILAAATLSIHVEYCSCFTASSAPVVPPKPSSITTLVLFASSTTGTSGDGTSTSNNNNDVLREGRLVEFTSGTGASKTTTLGAIVGPDGKRNLKILTSSGRTPSVPPRSIKHIVPNGRSIYEEIQIEQHERAAVAALGDDAAVKWGQSVAEVWEMMLEDGDEAEPVELTTLADLIAGDSDSVSCYVTRAVLADGVERFCFKEISPKGGKLSLSDNAYCPMYEPIPAAIVETMRSRAKVEALEKAKWEELKQRIDDACKIRSRSSDNVVPVFHMEHESEEIQAALQSLERLGCLANLSPEEAQREEKAAIGDDDEAIACAKQFLQKISRRATPEVAQRLLIGLGLWSEHKNLDLLRLNVPTVFGQYLEDAAIEIASSPAPDLDEASRLDLTHLLAFAIDEASSREIDDALSVEILKTDGPMHSRQRLWVHIADPSRFIELGSPLDISARRRASSIYLPTETIPMFPMSLASGPLSLSPGEVACALSVGLMLDDAGGIDESTPPVITPSLVKTTRLTYDQVDMLLDPFAMVDDPSSSDSGSENDTLENVEATVKSLRQLEWASQQRLQWRKDGGSLESIGPYELPDMSVKARPSADAPDGWKVEIVARERYAASRIVTELMLAANEAVAMYGDTHGVPMPFRCQEVQGVSDAEIDATPEGPCRSWLAIRSTTRSQITSNPLPHGGLGLDLYVQATSPVRRYADLAVHHQIKAHLRGDALPFPGNDTLLRLAQNGGTLSRQLERAANDYWLKEFLRRRGTQPIQALVLSSDGWKENVYKILLPELGAIFTYRSNKSLAIGEQMDMQSLPLADFV